MLSGSEIRRLLALRRRLRTEMLALSIARQRKLLAAMQTTRRTLIPGPRDPIPEFSTGEVLREFKWMLNTLSLQEAEAAVRVLEGLQRETVAASARRRKRSPAGH